MEVRLLVSTTFFKSLGKVGLKGVNEVATLVKIGLKGVSEVTPS